MVEHLAQTLSRRLLFDFGLTPVVATEVEFYLHGPRELATGIFWHEVHDACDRANIRVIKTEAERGSEQYEVALAPTPNMMEAVRHAQELRHICEMVAARHRLYASFAARPSPTEPGSGLHVHLHLENQNGESVFFKQDEQISEELKYSIGGLLATMRAAMPYFAPYNESYERFTGEVGGSTPSTVSWGANNRTAAVRLPDVGAPKRHLEHRVAGADARPLDVICAVLAGVHYGIYNKMDPGPQMYGDAAMTKYALPPLPRSFGEALNLLREDKVLRAYGLPMPQ